MASKDLTDPILGEDLNSYAVQIHEHQSITCRTTSNRFQIKKTSSEAKHSNVGIHINLDELWMDVYFNGEKFLSFFWLMLYQTCKNSSMLIYLSWFYGAFLLFSSLQKCINSNHNETLICSLTELKIGAQTQKKLLYLTDRQKREFASDTIFSSLS